MPRRWRAGRRPGGRRVALGLTVVAAWAALAPVGQARAVEFWYLDQGWTYKDVMKQLLSRFEQETGLKVNLVPMTDVHQKLPVAVAGGSGPDVAAVDSTMPLVWALTSNLLLPLEKHLEGAGHRPVGYLQREVSFGGHQYALPFDFQLRGLYWNVDHLSEAGYDASRPPQTLAELDEYARRLTRLDASGQIERLGFYPAFDNWNAPGWLWTFGGELFDWGQGRVTLVSPAHLRALSWMQSYGQRLRFADVQRFYQGLNGSLEAFANGRVSLLPHAATFIPYLKRQFPQLRFETGRVPSPPEGRNGVWPGGLAVVVPVGGGEAEAVGKLLRFLARPEVGLEWFRLTAQARFPTDVRALPRVQAELRDVQMRHMVEQAAALQARPPLWGSFLSVTDRARNEVLQLAKTPEQALADAQRELEGLLASAGVLRAWQGSGAR